MYEKTQADIQKREEIQCVPASPTPLSIHLLKILFIYYMEMDVSVLLQFTFLFLTKEPEHFFITFLADKHALFFFLFFFLKIDFFFFFFTFKFLELILMCSAW